MLNAEELKLEQITAAFCEMLAGGAKVITTMALAHKLLEKYQVDYRKESHIIRKKLIDWWESFEWRKKPVSHKKICGVALFLSYTKFQDFCMLEPSRSLIEVYPNQDEFIEKDVWLDVNVTGT